MADFVAVLKKTLDGLNNPTPETRQRVYERARTTIASRIDAMNPPPPASVRDAQLRALEDAVKTVEQGYSRKSLDPLDELEDVFRSLNGMMNQPTTPAPKSEPIAPAKVAPTSEVRSPLQTRPLSPERPIGERPLGERPIGERPVQERPRIEPLPRREVPPMPERVMPAPRPVTTPVAPPIAAGPRPVAPSAPPKLPPVRDPSRPVPVEAKAPEPRPAPPKEEVSDIRLDAVERDTDVMPAKEVSRPESRRVIPPEREKSGGLSFGKIAAVVIGLAAVGGAGYGIWLNKDEFQRIVGLTPPATTVATAPAEQTPAPTETAEAPVAETPPETPAETAEPVKLTQRLNEDGSEVDMGPASGQAAIGEGTSVAAVTQPPGPIPGVPPVDTSTPLQAAPDAAPADVAAATPDAPATPADPTVPASTPAAQGSLAVAQKAIFYEERTSAAQGSAEPGTTVWSLVQESPGGGRPPEPAIKGVISIPDREIGISLTIRRNADPTLPASHIMEMIFITPDNFSEGTVDNILRVALKSDEQQPGSPLIGLPAKIGDGFFLVALNSSKAEVDANMNLLRRQNWLDIAFVYKSGRRALVTMEKGVPGEKVFDDAMKAWGVANAG